jgi:8-oxo-dGTP diphosphatase
MKDDVLVVAAAIVRDGYVLAARRSRPDHLAGRWEFPGGKVEAGESDVGALLRECREELSVALSIADRLGEARNGDLRLVLYLATIDGGEPAAGIDHDELRWLSATELGDIDWLPIDRELLDAVRAVL